MPRSLGEQNTPTTTMGAVVSVNGAVCGIAYGGQIFEATDPQGLVPSVGVTVLADYLPSARQWVIVAIVT